MWEESFISKIWGRYFLSECDNRSNFSSDWITRANLPICTSQLKRRRFDLICWDDAICANNINCLHRKIVEFKNIRDSEIFNLDCADNLEDILHLLFPSNCEQEIASTWHAGRYHTSIFTRESKCLDQLSIHKTRAFWNS